MSQGSWLSSVSDQVAPYGILIMESKYNPGSDQARNAGCTCPVMDNSNGKGYMGMDGVFVYNENCEYHSEIINRVKSHITKSKNDKE